MLGSHLTPGGDALRRRLQALERRNAELELLFESLRDLTTTLSVREVLERLIGRVLDHLSAEIGSILLLDADGRMRIVVSRGLPADVVPATCLTVGEGISGLVAATGDALLVKDIESDPRFRRRNHERYYTSSFISAPLIHAGVVRGVINVNNKRSRNVFESSDLRLLEAIAAHASSALANAQEYEALLERAQRDSLTGLINHGHFWSSLQVEFRRAARHGRALALAMIDVDHFKAFNDRFGHPAGDEALRRVAQALEANSRSHDVVARYGGEEFAVILPETPLEGARVFAEKMRGSIEEARFGPGCEARLSVSVGVAVAEANLRGAQELVARADACLYQAKASGRNRVCTVDSN